MPAVLDGRSVPVGAYLVQNGLSLSGRIVEVVRLDPLVIAKSVETIRQVEIEATRQICLPEMHPAPLETGSADPVFQCAFPFDRAYVLAACLVSSAENFSELVGTRPDSWAKAGFVVKKSGEAEGRYLALVMTLRVLHGWPGGDVLQDVKTSKFEWFHLFDGLDSGSYANATSTKAVRVSKR